jgi:predicted N-acyltransferase
LKLSSLHLLFGSDEDLAACEREDLMLRHTVQFHWKNMAPKLVADAPSRPPEGEHFALGRPGGKMASFSGFDAFLATLNQEKRKKIKQERRKVREAGVTLKALQGLEITESDWSFFYECYELTYLEHGNPPYLTRDFFKALAAQQPENWVLFIAEREERRIASSLIAVDSNAAYGRYWGALERVDCLHFEACYYAPIEWCIARGLERFEGGAQGEHKLARALLPVQTSSAHWLAHPAFAQAVQEFLEREGEHMALYIDELERHSPVKRDQEEARANG